MEEKVAARLRTLEGVARADERGQAAAHLSTQAMTSFGDDLRRIRQVSGARVALFSPLTATVLSASSHSIVTVDCVSCQCVFPLTLLYQCAVFE